MILFFDTETTGMADFKSPPSADHQPHLVQLGAILCDSHRRVVAEMNLLIKPTGWTVPDEAAAIHGITTDLASRYGVGLPATMRLFFALCERAELMVAHNFQFDDCITQAAYCRAGLHELLGLHRRRQSYCTMKSATPILKLPGKYGDFKWPNLQEAHQHFLGRKFEGAHDAMADVRACRDVYYAMTAKPAQQANLPLPTVE